MPRLILFLALLAALLLAAAALVTLARTLRGPRAPGPETAMPPALRVVSYVLLLALLLGVAAGLLGPS